MPVISLEISGNDKQETRSGYNKIKIIRVNETKNGITFTNNGDGSCTLNGTNNATGAIYFNLNLDSNNAEYFTLTKNKKYYMYLKGLKTGTSLMARSRNNQNFSLILSSEISKITEWTKETATDGIVYIEVLAGTTFNNETFYPMLAESDVELEYESYGAMPSPSYPSEVETVNTQASVVVSNKNVFSFEKAEKLATYAMPFYEVIDNNSIELKNSADWAYIQYQYILKKDTQYTISFDLEFEGADNVTQWWTTIEDSLGSIATDFVTLVNNKYIKTFTTREDMIVKIKLFASTPINPALTIIKNIQIEEGNTATEYVPFMLQTKVVDIQQEMLEGDYFVKEEDGWKEVHLWGKYVFTGNENFSFGNAYQDKYRRFSMAYDESLNVKKASWDEIGAKSNYFKGIANKDYSTAQNNVWINEQSRFNIGIDIAYLTEDSANGLKAWLAQKHTEGNPVYVWYKLATPTRLACTEKQVQQLDDLLNTSTYKNVTHIYSTDKVSPVIKVVYKKDLETMFNQIYKNLI